MSNLREEFEKLPEISKRLKMSDGVYWSEHYKNYNSLNEHDDYAVGFVNGAWMAFQEQQKKLDAVKSKLSNIYDDCDDNTTVALLLDEIQELLK